MITYDLFQLSSSDNKLIWALITCYGGESTRLSLIKKITHLVTAGKLKE